MVLVFLHPLRRGEDDMGNKLTILDIIEKKTKNEKFTMLTAYDAAFASLLDGLGIDILLVGDSLGMVILGYESTVPVTMDEMIHHAKAVKRGVRSSLLVGDMPFLSYQAGKDTAIANAGRFLKEAGCDGVKVEGGIEVCDIVHALVTAGIPVMGHIGLTPQTASQLGGYRVQGRDLQSARRLLDAARALNEVGVFSLVLECIPDRLAGRITELISVPTIGIGAGPFCDGQVLVTHDLLGLFERFTPRFVRRYADLSSQIKDAVSAFKEDVSTARFPGEEHSFSIADEVLKGLGED